MSWIPTIHQLPEEGVEVLGWSGMWTDGCKEFCKMEGEVWKLRVEDEFGNYEWSTFGKGMEPTMWTPIPKLPIEP